MRHLTGAKESPIGADYVLHSQPRDNAADYPQLAKGCATFFVGYNLASLDAPIMPSIYRRKIKFSVYVGSN